jgi:hypothetical protein
VDQDKGPSGIVSVNMNPTIRQILMSAPVGAFEAFLDLHVFLIANKSRFPIPKRSQRKEK